MVINSTQKKVTSISWWSRYQLNRALKAYYNHVDNTTDKLTILRLSAETLRKVRDVLNKDPDDHYLVYLYKQLNVTINSPFSSLGEQLNDLTSGVKAFRDRTPVARSLKGLTGLAVKEHEGIDFMLIDHRFDPYGCIVKVIKLLDDAIRIYHHRVENETALIVNNDFTLLADRVRKLMECLEGYFIAMSVSPDVMDEAVSRRAGMKGV